MSENTKLVVPVVYVIRCLLCPEVARYTEKNAASACGWRSLHGIGRDLAGVCPSCAQTREGPVQP